MKNVNALRLLKASPGREAGVTLASFGGHASQEVAVLLDIAEGTADSGIRDGLIKLRDRFGVSP